MPSGASSKPRHGAAVSTSSSPSNTPPVPIRQLLCRVSPRASAHRQLLGARALLPPLLAPALLPTVRCALRVAEPSSASIFLRSSLGGLIKRVQGYLRAALHTPTLGFRAKTYIKFSKISELRENLAAAGYYCMAHRAYGSALEKFLCLSFTLTVRVRLYIILNAELSICSY